MSCIALMQDPDKLLPGPANSGRARARSKHPTTVLLQSGGFWAPSPHILVCDVLSHERLESIRKLKGCCHSEAENGQIRIPDVFMPSKTDPMQPCPPTRAMIRSGAHFPATGTERCDSMQFAAETTRKAACYRCCAGFSAFR
jgi:hypothetical protein